MRARWLVVPAALAAGLLARPAAPVNAEVCITATVYQAGEPTTSGPHCQPLLDELPPLCQGPGVLQSGYGARVTLCIPDVM